MRYEVRVEVMSVTGHASEERFAPRSEKDFLVNAQFIAIIFVYLSSIAVILTRKEET